MRFFDGQRKRALLAFLRVQRTCARCNVQQSELSLAAARPIASVGHGPIFYKLIAVHSSFCSVGPLAPAVTAWIRRAESVRASIALPRAVPLPPRQARPVTQKTVCVVRPV